MKLNRFFIVLISTIAILFIMSSCTYAKDDSTQGSVDDTTSKLITDMKPQDTPPTSRLTKILAQFFSVIQFAGTGISVIMVMWVGISYMVSSVEQKAEIKKRSVPILIGSILIVSTVNILKFLTILIGVSTTDDEPVDS